MQMRYGANAKEVSEMPSQNFTSLGVVLYLFRFLFIPLLVLVYTSISI